MSYNKDKQHAVDILFVLILFCVFTLTSLAVVYTGSRVYSTTVDTMDNNFHNHVAIDYLIEKVHQAKGNVYVQKIDGIDVLCMEETIQSKKYITYIYCYEKQLKEVSMQASDKLQLNSGDTIMNIDALTMKINKSLLQVKLINNHTSHAVQIALVKGGGVE